VEVVDYRWNKIRLLVEALQTYAKQYKYVVWIDSDAIILDFGWKIETFIEPFPHVDIFASADIRQGLINTGVLIVRNTVWSLSFLEQWWAIADRKTTCDQDAFDMAYKYYKQKEKNLNYFIINKISILQIDIINRI
jgi:hypothetical protein